MTYGDSGVDVAVGMDFVEGIKELVRSTLIPGTFNVSTLLEFCWWDLLYILKIVFTDRRIRSGD